MYLKKPYSEHFELGDGFGDRIHPLTKKITKHNGIDIPMPVGISILSPMNGIANIYADFPNKDKLTGYGNYVTVSGYSEQGSKVKLLFAHLDKVSIKDGQSITAFTEIGLSGKSGGVTGPHLHFGVMVNGEWVNPEQYVNFA